MATEFATVLNSLRANSNTDNDLGNSFEQLTKVFLENDDIQKDEFSKVWHYSDWAKTQTNYSSIDIGIDLVAKLKKEDGFCAIQCKCFQANRSISKADLDSFISASATPDFKRLLLVDTSSLPLSKNAQKVFDNLETEFIRIQQSQLESSRINWTSFVNDGEIILKEKKTPLDHQIKAISAVKQGFSNSDRGKLIMACGTGKTFTSLSIVEEILNQSGKVLYMVPSLSLMSQTIREWKNDSKKEFNAFSACSDKKVGKRKITEDQIDINLNQLAFPATTNPEKLSEQVIKAESEKLTVIFSTYHSIDVISKAQKKFDMGDFDLIICDEAHRTTGATFIGEEDSNFVKIHDNEYISGKKRLYMTATPKIYGESAQRKEQEGEVKLYPMDNEDIFGKTFFYRGFGWAVENNLLSDYKVVVLNINEQQVSDRIQSQFTEGNELNLADATKMIGCYKALAKIGIADSSPQDFKTIKPMRKALAFLQTINASKLFSDQFSDVINEYQLNEKVSDLYKSNLEVEIHHVDGGFNAEERNDELRWLEDDTNENNCRILSNARCLTEGVDVPALDAVMFLHPRKSQIDVVQSVGRVMRKSEGKKIGYVIIPIAVAPGISATKALQDNERYKVVWQILNALRTHDERLDSTINKIALGEDVSDKIEIIDGDPGAELNATTATIEDVYKKNKRKPKDGTGNNKGGDDENQQVSEQQLSFTISDLNQAIKAKIVEKCGTREYWEKWAEDIARIAELHITRIKSIVFNKDSQQYIAFKAFLEEIRDDLNPQITESDAVEMLAQHIVTKPVFETLFKGNKFTSENAISKSMEGVLKTIYQYDFQGEQRSLEKFYMSVKRRAEGIITSNGRQKLIFELYDRFFRNAFPLLTQKLGIVYTPIEIVDFIIQSIEFLLNKEFKKSIANQGVHILDPFVGTGTFITRLIQAGIIPKERLLEKYKSEIHANEIVLLACYIAGINIESVYSDIIQNEIYEPFSGIVLTDTFQLFEQDKDMIANLLPDNSQRRTNQKKQNLTVIFGNPPYSKGQTSADDNAANIKYPNLDKRIEETYAANSRATNKNALYDSYIKAFRWASDRIGSEGIIAFITNAGWIEGNSMEGFRKSLNTEFDKIYICNLRGNARTSGELRRKEKGNVFGSGTRTPVAITFLIKSKINSSEEGKINFYDIGDYLTTEQKLSKISKTESIKTIIEKDEFEIVEPDEDNNWINQGEKDFKKHISMGNKTKNYEITIFKNYTNGLMTARDAWCYNPNKNKLISNIKQTMRFYNSNLNNSSLPIDKSAIGWSSGIIQDFKNKKEKFFDETRIYKSNYRPFNKTNYVYFDRTFNERVYQMPKIFPTNNHQNKLIVIRGIGIAGNTEFSCLMVDAIPDKHALANSQCFPLYLYNEDSNDEQTNLFTKGADKGKESAISEEGFNYFSRNFSDIQITKEDIFYYVYGILHSKEYTEKYRNNLSKELPRIPLCKNSKDFQTFAELGKALSELHLNFDNAEKFPITFKEGDLRLMYIEDRRKFFKLEKMKFAKKNNKTSVIYNRNLTIENIPEKAFKYKVNGRSALEWVMDTYIIKKDKETGIQNNINDFINENHKDPEYFIELFQKIITVSLKTLEIIESLPSLNF